MADRGKKILSSAEIERLGDIIMLLQRSFVQGLSVRLNHGQISFPQFFLLTHIASRTDMTMTEIAERMNHSTAAATGLVDRLEKLGHVCRAFSPTDRRKVLVNVTESGASLVENIRNDILKNLEKFMGNLTIEEQLTWLRVHEKLLIHSDQNHNIQK